MKIRPVTAQDYILICQYYIDNTDHLAPWEPLRDGAYHHLENWEKRIKKWVNSFDDRSEFHFLALNDKEDEIIAICSLTGVTFGVFQAAFMGFSIGSKYQGQGLMKQLCQHVIDFAFNTIRLNRIMANYLPHNARSAGLLKKLGFVVEGKANKYLKINGKWEDHILTSLINPNNS